LIQVLWMFTKPKSKPSKVAAEVKEKVEGAVEKVASAVEGKPAKKAAGTKKVKGETTTKKAAPAKKAAAPGPGPAASAAPATVTTATVAA